MDKYTVHFGIRLTYDIEVEARTEEEARSLAETIFESIDYNDMEYASTDMDVWKEVVA